MAAKKPTPEVIEAADTGAEAADTGAPYILSPAMTRALDALVRVIHQRAKRSPGARPADRAEVLHRALSFMAEECASKRDAEIVLKALRGAR